MGGEKFLSALTGALYATLCTFAYGEMFVGWSRILDWIYDHETLTGAFLAVASAFVGAWLLYRQTTQQRRLEEERAMRRREAARSVLPLALAALSDYATESAYVCKALLDLCSKKALPVPVTMPLPPMPAVPTDAIQVLKELIEWIEDEHIRTLSGFIADIQVQHSRIESTLSTAKSGIGPIITTFNLEEYAVDCAIIHARSSSLFDYGRRRSKTIPHQITWEMVSRAVTVFDLDDFAYPDLHAMIDRRSGSKPHSAVPSRWRES